jgi:hypothetical protein
MEKFLLLIGNEPMRSAILLEMLWQKINSVWQAPKQETF